MNFMGADGCLPCRLIGRHHPSTSATWIGGAAFAGQAAEPEVRGEPHEHRNRTGHPARPQSAICHLPLTQRSMTSGCEFESRPPWSVGEKWKWPFDPITSTFS